MRRVITRRNLIRAGIAAPFILPKYAEALSRPVEKALLGGARGPQAPSWVTMADGGAATIDLQFSNNRYWGGLPSALLLTARSTSGYAVTKAGVLVSFAPSTLRITDNGLLDEESRTNKCTNTNLNPITTTGNAAQGDGAAVFSVVSDNTALVALGLSAGNVLKLDNTAGVGSASIFVSGLTGNTNTHFGSAYVRGTGNCGIGVVTSGTIPSAATALTAGYQRISTSGTGSASNGLAISVAAGGILFVVLNQMEQGGCVTSPIAVAGATNVRAADALLAAGLLASLLLSHSFSIIWTQGQPIQAYSAAVRLLSANTDTGFWSPDTDTDTRISWAGFVTSSNAFTGGAAWDTTPVKAGMSLNTSGALSLAGMGAAVATATRTPSAGNVTMHIASQAGALTTSINSYIQELALFNQKITDASLQSLTAGFEAITYFNNTLSFSGSAGIYTGVTGISPVPGTAHLCMEVPGPWIAFQVILANEFTANNTWLAGSAIAVANPSTDKTQNAAFAASSTPITFNGGAGLTVPARNFSVSGNGPTLAFSDICYLPSVARTDVVGALPCLAIRMVQTLTLGTSEQVTYWIRQGSNWSDGSIPFVATVNENGDKRTSSMTGTASLGNASQTFCPIVGIRFFTALRSMTVMFDGDSIVSSTLSTLNSRPYGWPGLASHAASTLAHPVFSANIGISGQTSTVYTQFTKYALSLMNPSHLIHHAYSPNDIANVISQSMLDGLTANTTLAKSYADAIAAKFAVTNCTPRDTANNVGNASFFDATNSNIAENYKQVTIPGFGYPFIDTSVEVQDGSVPNRYQLAANGWPADLSDDGLHPNQAGQPLLVPNVQAGIAALQAVHYYGF